jgi:transcriptional regulator with XRE-family HTH domain
MTEETFGTLLKTKRRDADLSQRELAKQIGVDFSYISKLENDRLPPPAADTIVKICQVLGTEPDEMLALTGKLPTEIQENIASNLSAQQFLREAGEMRLTNEEWQSLTASLKQFRDDATSGG